MDLLNKTLYYVSIFIQNHFHNNTSLFSIHQDLSYMSVEGKQESNVLMSLVSQLPRLRWLTLRLSLQDA